jgi:hypothetical protein
VLAAAHAAGLDFVVLTEHVVPGEQGPLPAAERAGVYTAADGHRVAVLVGAEFGTQAGHLLGLRITRTVREGLSGREAIAEIHAQGGFAVVPHPFSYGGWHDWEAPFDGMEVQNNAADFRRLVGPLLPLRLVRHAFDPTATRRAAWVRPALELERWESLLASGRRVIGLAGSDAHQERSLLDTDTYEVLFPAIRMLCPAAPLEADAIWDVLSGGCCRVRYEVYGEREGDARAVRFPSGRVELQLDGGRRVLEIRPPGCAGLY